jgi:hypothetical protein
VPVVGEGAPRGPRGSSTASSLVDCRPYCRRRGPRPAGERGAEAAVGAGSADGLVEGAGESVSSVSFCSTLDALGAGLDREGTSGSLSALRSIVDKTVDTHLPTGSSLHLQGPLAQYLVVCGGGSS